MRVKQPIDNLLGGVSTAPPWRRAANQVTEQINAIPSRVRGLVKRPPVSVASHDHLPWGRGVTHDINIGNQRYTALFVGGDVQIYDEDGAEVPVAGGASTYLAGSEKPRAVTVGERTYVVNPGVTVGKQTPILNPPANKLNEALIWVRVSTASLEYSISSSEEPLGVRITAADASTLTLAADIQATFESFAGDYTITNYGSVLHIVYNSGQSFTPKVHGPNGGFDVVVIQDAVKGVEDLPPEAPEGFVVGVMGDPSSDVDDFYVIREGKRWEETLRPGHGSSLDPATMPHALDYDPDTDSWSFSSLVWEERLVGDDTTNPDPSFVSDTINEVFFAEGRLGLISKNKIILSRSGEPTALFRETVRAYRANAPIDIKSTAEGASSFHSALEWNERPYLFSTTGAYILWGDPILSPRTVSLRSLGKFRSTNAFRPPTSGDKIFLTRETETGPQVSIFTDSKEYPARSTDITEGMGKYIKGTPVALAADDELGFVALTTDADLDAIYVYFYAVHPNGQVSLSNWSRWELHPDTEILDMTMDRGVLVVALTNFYGYVAKMDVKGAMYGDVPVAWDLDTFPYDMTVELSPIYLRDDSGRADTSGRLDITYLEVLMGLGSGEITVDIERDGRDLETLDKTEDKGRIKLPVMAEGDKTKITLTCKDTNDCEITGLYWQGFYSDTNQRV